jgi:hypothetical protein
MRSTLINATALLCGLALAGPALGQSSKLPPPTVPTVTPVPARNPVASSQSTEQADRVTLRTLTRKVRRIDRETDDLMDRAMQEARDNNGKANPETKAKLLSLRDERDRHFSRMLVISMRHGWPIPDLDRSTATESEREDYEASVFGSVDVLVQRRFAVEAKRMAGRITMPVVSLESMGG